MDDMNHRRLLIGIAHDYYLSKINIAEISKKYQVSRYLISKYLDEAMATGLVKININTPIERNSELEAKFKHRFPIEHIYIINGVALSLASSIIFKRALVMTYCSPSLWVIT